MNGKPLPVNHGFPVRMIVPGVSGCRSVKWVDEITVQLEESRNLYQRYDYKRLPPEATDKETAKQYWDRTPSLQDMPINSVIAEPNNNDTIRLPPSGNIEIKGYALPQGGSYFSSPSCLCSSQLGAPKQCLETPVLSLKA